MAIILYEGGWSEDNAGMVYFEGRPASISQMHVFTLAKLEGRLRPRRSLGEESYKEWKAAKEASERQSRASNQAALEAQMLKTQLELEKARAKFKEALNEASKEYDEDDNSTEALKKRHDDWVKKMRGRG